jgi:hypothetical protein
LVAEHLVDIGRLHAVGHERELEVVARALAHAALAGDLLHVPEVGPAGGRGLELFAVVGHDGGPHEQADAAVGDGGGEEVGLVADLGIVELLEQALVAAARRIGRLDLDHVPGDLLGLDHGLDLGLLAVVFDRDDLGAGLLVGLVVGLLLRVGVGAAEVDHGELLLGEGRQREAGGDGAGEEGLFHGGVFLGDERKEGNGRENGRRVQGV